VKRTNISNLSDIRFCQSARGISRTSIHALRAKASEINSLNKYIKEIRSRNNDTITKTRTETIDLQQKVVTLNLRLKPSDES